MITKIVSLEILIAYHKKLMEYINSLIVNRAFEYSHCPNCGAIITGDSCEFCGTIFRKDKDNE